MRTTLAAALVAASTAIASPPQRAASPASLEAVAALVRDARDASGAPSIAYAVVVDTHIVAAGAFGLSDPERGIAATPETLYEIGSVTKTFTGLLYQQARARGSVTADDAVTRWLPAAVVPAYPGDAAAPTLGQLATHTAGLPRGAPVDVFGRAHPSLPEFFASLASAHAAFPARTTYKYSNLGVELLGHAVAAAQDTTWSVLVRREILGPLGMARTIDLSAGAERGEIAAGFLPGPDGLRRVEPMAFHPGMAPSGALASNARDLGRYVAFHLAADEAWAEDVLPARWRRDLITPGWMLPDWSAGVAVTWFIARHERGVLVHHAGGTLGHLAEISFLPDQRLGVVLLTNGWMDLHGLARTILARLEVEAQVVDVPAPAFPARWTGTYRLPGGEFPPVTLAEVNGAVTLESAVFGRVPVVARNGRWVCRDNEMLDGEDVAVVEAAEGPAGDRLVLGNGMFVHVRAP